MYSAWSGLWVICFYVNVLYHPFVYVCASLFCLCAYVTSCSSCACALYCCWAWQPHQDPTQLLVRMPQLPLTEATDMIVNALMEYAMQFCLVDFCQTAVVSDIIHSWGFSRDAWWHQRNPVIDKLCPGIATSCAIQCILADALLDVTTQEMHANLAATRCGMHCWLQDVTRHHVRDKTHDSH